MKSKYVYAVTYRKEKNGRSFLIFTIRTDDNCYFYFPENLVKFFGRKRDAEKYAQEQCKDDWLVGCESSYQFV